MEGFLGFVGCILWYVGFLPFLFFSFSLSHALNVVCLSTCFYQAYIWFLFLVLDHKLINKKHGRCIYACDSFLLGDWSLERHFPICKSVENMTYSHALILLFCVDDLVNQVLLILSSYKFLGLLLPFYVFLLVYPFMSTNWSWFPSKFYCNWNSFCLYFNYEIPFLMLGSFRILEPEFMTCCGNSWGLIGIYLFWC